MTRPRFSRTLGYERPHAEPGHVEHDPHAEVDLALTKKIAAVVEFHYPGQPFLIQVTHAQGVVKIQIPALMGPTNWFVVPLARLATDPNLKLIVRGCGDILERYNIPRAGYDAGHYLSALRSIPFGRRFHGYVPK